MEVTPCLWIGTLNIVQMVILSQMANRSDSMKSLLKFQLLFFFLQKWKMYLKIHTIKKKKDSYKVARDPE